MYGLVRRNPSPPAWLITATRRSALFVPCVPLVSYPDIFEEVDRTVSPHFHWNIGPSTGSRQDRVVGWPFLWPAVRRPKPRYTDPKLRILGKKESRGTPRSTLPGFKARRQSLGNLPRKPSWTVDVDCLVSGRQVSADICYLWTWLMHLDYEWLSGLRGFSRRLFMLCGIWPNVSRTACWTTLADWK
ncbi:unnamed protein product [Ixodes persulcatus]